ncbi:MAG TPA: transcription termination/antitermination NusG family protein [Candidatus Angelobacter sp.]|nr:transcription termination/antitermination NusG family protein [Candidatus Angelobacter sp.]
MNGPPNISSVSNVACWYVVHTHASQERRAEKNLNMWGIETFHPQMKKVQSNSGLRKPGVVIKSVFPCYLFARFNPDFMLHKISFTRGVRKILCANGNPVPIGEEIIALIKSRVQEDGSIYDGQTFRLGDKVIVVKGPLLDLVGVFEKELNDSDRVVVLLRAVDYQSRVVISKDSIEKVN